MSGAPDVFHEEFHETLAEVLNLGSWRSGRNVDEEYRQIEAEVRLVHVERMKRRIGSLDAG